MTPQNPRPPEPPPAVWRRFQTCPYCDKPDLPPHQRRGDGKMIYCPVAGPIII